MDVESHNRGKMLDSVQISRSFTRILSEFAPALAILKPSLLRLSESEFEARGKQSANAECRSQDEIEAWRHRCGAYLD